MADSFDINSQNDDLSHFSSGEESESLLITVKCKICQVTFMKGEVGSSSFYCSKCELCCCCGCGGDASQSNHFCSTTGKQNFW